MRENTHGNPVFGTLVLVSGTIYWKNAIPPYLGLETDGKEHLIVAWEYDKDQRNIPRRSEDIYHWTQPPEEWIE